jgi:hypothetical protein
MLKHKAFAKPLNITGSRIRLARMALRPRISQIQLAARLTRLGLQLDQAAISRIEHRQRGVLDYELAAIARCLKISVAWLFRETALDMRR